MNKVTIQTHINFNNYKYGQIDQKYILNIMNIMNNPSQDQFTVCITGAAGQIAYSFIPQLLKGNAFPNRRINLRLLDITPALSILKGVVMEIHDGAFPLCKSVEYGDNARQMFKDADVIVFIGGLPRKKGMQRKDLLQKNKNIFVEQAKALDAAKPNVKCVVVANPANTNATILSHYSKVRPQNITCLTRLDHNRAISQIAQKVGADQSLIEGIMIFGNHSPTQYPCLKHIKVNGKPIQQLVSRQWLEKQFIPNVQKRGAQILNVRGGSSVFSAASSTIDHLRDWYQGTDKIVSMGVKSQGQYGIPTGLWTSLPVRCKNFEYEVVKNIELSQYCKKSIQKTVKQLQEELKDAQVQIKEIKPKL